jgi:hypothetical protein
VEKRGLNLFVVAVFLVEMLEELEVAARFVHQKVLLRGCCGVAEVKLNHRFK